MNVSKTRLVWGVVSGLLFLVLVQGVELATGTRFGIPLKGGVTVAVTMVTSILATGIVTWTGWNGRS